MQYSRRRVYRPMYCYHRHQIYVSWLRQSRSVSAISPEFYWRPSNSSSQPFVSSRELLLSFASSAGLFQPLKLESWFYPVSSFTIPVDPRFSRSPSHQCQQCCVSSVVSAVSSLLSTRHCSGRPVSCTLTLICVRSSLSLRPVGCCIHRGITALSA